MTFSAPAATTTAAATRSSAVSTSASPPGACCSSSSASAPCTAGRGGGVRPPSRLRPRSPCSSLSRRRFSLERRAFLVGHLVRVLLLGECAAAHLLREASERFGDRVADLRVALHEPWCVTLGVTEHVVPDEHLAVRVRART